MFIYESYIFADNSDAVKEQALLLCFRASKDLLNPCIYVNSRKHEEQVITEVRET
jgi:hypothetical protein